MYFHVFVPCEHEKAGLLRLELLASDTSSIEGGPPFSAEPHGWGISVSVSGEFQRAPSSAPRTPGLPVEEGAVISAFRRWPSRRRRSVPWSEPRCDGSRPVHGRIHNGDVTNNTVSAFGVHGLPERTAQQANLSTEEQPKKRREHWIVHGLQDLSVTPGPATTIRETSCPARCLITVRHRRITGDPPNVKASNSGRQCQWPAQSLERETGFAWNFGFLEQPPTPSTVARRIGMCRCRRPVPGLSTSVTNEPPGGQRYPKSPLPQSITHMPYPSAPGRTEVRAGPVEKMLSC